MIRLGNAHVDDGLGGRFGGIALDGGRLVEFLQPGQAFDLDLGGATVWPGLTDSHVHLSAIGETQTMVDLSRVTSLSELAVLLRNCKALSNGVRIGVGYGGRECPDPGFFASEFPNERVAILGRDLHSAWVSPSLRSLYAHGNLNDSLVTDAGLDALGLRFSIQDRVDQFVKAGLRACADAGLTEVHEIAASPAAWSALCDLDRQGHLPVRVAVYGYGDEWVEMDTGYRSEMLKFCGFKVFLDGALTSRGAWLSEPYADCPDTCGEELMAWSKLLDWWHLAVKKGLQLAVHAIGDAAVNRALDLPHGGDAGLRIEHAQVVRPDDIMRFRGVVAAMQPAQRVDDAPILATRLGGRASWAYPFQAIQDAGGVVCFGSDAPVADLSPLKGIEAATNAGFVTPLTSYTHRCRQAIRSAQASGLTLGEAADFIVIRDGSVTERWVGGRLTP